MDKTFFGTVDLPKDGILEIIHQFQTRNGFFYFTRHAHKSSARSLKEIQVLEDLPKLETETREKVIQASVGANYEANSLSVHIERQ